MNFSKNNKNTLIITILIGFVSLIIATYIGEDTLGGAKYDYLFHEKYITSFYENFFQTLKEFGNDYARDIVSNAKALAVALAAEGFDVLAEDRGYTASHQVLTRHGEIDSGAGRKAAEILEQSGIITNMNMLPGDTKAMQPSGLRLGVPELTRVGMGTDEMTDVLPTELPSST